MRESVVALALAGAVAGPLGAYIATGADLGGPIYSGWKLLFFAGTVLFALLGLVGAVVALHEPGWGSVLLGIAAVAIFSLVFLIAIRDQPLGGSLLSAAPPAIPCLAAFGLTAFRYAEGSWQEDDEHRSYRP